MQDPWNRPNTKRFIIRFAGVVRSRFRQRGGSSGRKINTIRQKRSMRACS